MVNRFKSSAPIFLALCLAACGGGGGGGAELGSSAGAGAALVGPSLSGVAATGAAIAAGKVTFKCWSGSTAAVTTAGDGSYSVGISDVTLPCMGRVEFTDSAGAVQRLHTIVAAAGTANITPITDLIVSHSSGQSAALEFDQFQQEAAEFAKASGIEKFSPEQMLVIDAEITTDAAAVLLYLRDKLGIDTRDFPANPITTRFQAKTNAQPGDKIDQGLDAFQARLVSLKKSLATVAQDIDVSLGNSSGPPIPPATTPSASSTVTRLSALGPAGEKTTLSRQCSPTLTPSSYNLCKAPADIDATIQAGIVNTWIQQLAGNLRVVSSDASLGIAVGDDCSFALNTSRGPWLLSFKTGRLPISPSIAFTGSPADTVQLAPTGEISFISAGDSFASANGKIEVYFPASGRAFGITYGKNGKQLSCQIRN